MVRDELIESVLDLWKQNRVVLSLFGMLLAICLLLKAFSNFSKCSKDPAIPVCQLREHTPLSYWCCTLETIPLFCLEKELEKSFKSGLTLDDLLDKVDFECFHAFRYLGVVNTFPFSGNSIFTKFGTKLSKWVHMNRYWNHKICTAMESKILSSIC